MSSTINKIIQNTCIGKGLVRDHYHHRGNFEIIEVRKSLQIIGSLLILPGVTHSHELNRESTNLNMLPYVRSITILFRKNLLLLAIILVNI